MFDIRLLPIEENRATDEPGARFGRIMINDFTERFRCCDTGVGIDEFVSQWRNQLHALLAGNTAVALVYDPRFAYIVYREGNRCFIQERMALDGRFETIPSRQKVTKDGDPVSEWSVLLQDIARFLKTNAG